MGRDPGFLDFVTLWNGSRVFCVLLRLCPVFCWSFTRYCSIGNLQRTFNLIPQSSCTSHIGLEVGLSFTALH